MLLDRWSNSRALKLGANWRASLVGVGNSPEPARSSNNNLSIKNYEWISTCPQCRQTLRWSAIAPTKIWFRSGHGRAVVQQQYLMTADGGGPTRQFDSTAYLRCVGFANRQIGWPTTDEEQRLYHTRNGAVLRALVPDLPRWLRRLSAAASGRNESVVYVSGE
jgi:hypothetical protein